MYLELLMDTNKSIMVLKEFLFEFFIFWWTLFWTLSMINVSYNLRLLDTEFLVQKSIFGPNFLRWIFIKWLNQFEVWNSMNFFFYVYLALDFHKRLYSWLIWRLCFLSTLRRYHIKQYSTPDVLYSALLPVN